MIVSTSGQSSDRSSSGQNHPKHSKTIYEKRQQKQHVECANSHEMRVVRFSPECLLPRAEKGSEAYIAYMGDSTIPPELATSCKITETSTTNEPYHQASP